MTRVVWNDPAERFYQSGLDRGVLYPAGLPGVPWNGLIGVDEFSSGGETQGYYIDGIKHLNNASPEEYTATLTAFSRPRDFAECEGFAGTGDGLFFGQQPRKSFGLSYRSGIGNDLVGLAYGHQIHLVYNAMATPAAKNRKTLTNTTTPMTLSWGLTVLPVTIAGRRATAHLVLETADIDPEILTEIEDALYGTVSTDPYLPTPLEMISFFAG